MSPSIHPTVPAIPRVLTYIDIKKIVYNQIRLILGMKITTDKAILVDGCFVTHRKPQNFRIASQDGKQE